MICSHNSFTYLNADHPTNPIYALLHRCWRCQSADIKKQYESGVRYFDIRVKRVYTGASDVWPVCWELAYGRLTLGHKVFTSLSTIAAAFDAFKDARIRLFLDHTHNDEDINAFRSEVATILKEHDNLDWAGIRDDAVNGITIYRAPDSPDFEDYGCVKWRPSIFSIFGKRNVYRWAMGDGHCELTQEMIEDKEKCYCMDYADLQIASAKHTDADLQIASAKHN